MALSEYSNVEVGSVYGYESFGTMYGVKVVKCVYVAELEELRFIVQHGQAKSGEKFVPYSDGKDLSVYSEKDLKDGCGKKYTEGSVYTKGDILSGTDMYGNRVILVFESEQMVHRLTKMNDSSLDQSSARLSYYQGKLKNIKVVTNTKSGLSFSEL